MTRAEEILYAVKTLCTEELQELTPKTIKQQMTMSDKEWQSVYSRTFNAMRVGSDTCNKVGQKYRNVFEKVYHGCYYLTDYGEQILTKLESNEAEAIIAIEN